MEAIILETGGERAGKSNCRIADDPDAKRIERFRKQCSATRICACRAQAAIWAFPVKSITKRRFRLALSGHGGELVAVDDALNALERFDSRKARVIELRFFGGLSVEETAEALAISPQSVMRDWKLAKSWLMRELRGTGAISPLEQS